VNQYVCWTPGRLIYGDSQFMVTSQESAAGKKDLSFRGPDFGARNLHLSDHQHIMKPALISTRRLASPLAAGDRSHSGEASR
jgi:hypothetical protein